MGTVLLGVVVIFFEFALFLFECRSTPSFLSAIVLEVGKSISLQRKSLVIRQICSVSAQPTVSSRRPEGKLKDFETLACQGRYGGRSFSAAVQRC